MLTNIIIKEAIMLYTKQLYTIILLSLSTQVIAEQSTISLNQVEALALKNESGIQSQQWQAKSLIEQSIADGELKDPKLQLGLNNLATDSFDFNQENMTQFKVGIIQQFPAGDTLKLKQQKTIKQSDLVYSKIDNRKLEIIKKVRLTYLELYYWEQAKITIKQNKKLFSQLIEIVQSLFSVGRNNQYDLISAQLSLSKLDDRLTKINQKINTQRSKLSRWIGYQNSRKTIAKELPELVFSFNSKQEDFETLSQYFYTHPKIQEVDAKLEIRRKDIQLIKESYKPGWALNVSYGYRDENINGQYRSDFISAGVTMDLPLFTANRQDKKLLSKEYAYQALKDQKIELLHQLVAELEQEITNEELYKQRHQLYRKILLPQAKQQEKASLLAYQSNKGNFSDVMRAYINNLNAHLDERRIAVDHLQTNTRILYLLGEK
jgi:outer membrane protein TolC